MWRALRAGISFIRQSRARTARARYRLTVCMGIALLFHASMAAGADSSLDRFTSAKAGYQFHFPDDHGAHPAYRTEWWYYTGHLKTDEGRAFGFELTFFRRGISPDDVKTQPSQWSITQLYLAHFAITDVSGRRFHFSEKLSRPGLGKAGADESGLHVWIDDWHATASAAPAGAQTVAAQDTGYALALTLEPAKPVVIHGLDGISRKGTAPGQASHYYSLTRLAAKGRLTIGKDSFNVTGTSWMDHEFGSADLGADIVGWDWFSIQLGDHSELMLYRLRRRDGTSDPVSSGTIVFPDGHTSHLALGDFQVEAKMSWTSPASQATYPNTWRIAVASLNLDLEVTPLVADQELRTSRSTQVTYWEGAVAVSGTKEGHAANGQGYVELTGYDTQVTNK
jgi:predicted secreted hydrolase